MLVHKSLGCLVEGYHFGIFQHHIGTLSGGPCSTRVQLSVYFFVKRMRDIDRIDFTCGMYNVSRALRQHNYRIFCGIVS